MSEQTKDGGQDLHARIMNLPCPLGHREARHAAAELAAEHGHALSLARSALEEREQRIRVLEEALGQASQVLQVVALDLANTQLAQYREMYRGGYKPYRIASAEAEVKSVEDAIQLARSVLNKENGKC